MPTDFRILIAARFLFTFAVLRLIKDFAAITHATCCTNTRERSELAKQINKKSRSVFETGLDSSFVRMTKLWFYNSNAFFTLPSINNSSGFSSASFTATKKPTDSRPSIIR